MSNQEDASNYYSLAHLGSTHPSWTGRFQPNPAVVDSAASGAHPPEAGDNDPDVYTFDDANEVDADIYEDGSPDLRVETTSFDNGEGSTV